MSIKRRTKSVNLILSFFNESYEAISVVNLINQLNDSMNKTTVYRILARLEGEGLIHSFVGTDGLKWYAKGHKCNGKHQNEIHPHFECKQCGKVECLDIDITIPNLKNRHIETADVLITGQCADCLSN